MDEAHVGPHVPSTLAPPPEKEAQVEVASQWQLMWWRFKQHKVALASAIVVVLIYVVALIPEFLAPYPSDVVNARYLYAPPQPLHLFSTDGGLRFAPHVSGYYGGIVDTAIQRVIEFLRSIPTIPLWMGLAAALPSNWPPLQIYFGITIILSLIGWTGLARVVRGRFLAMRTEEFVTAARLDGASDMRIILRYMAPSFPSPSTPATTLAIP